MEKEINQMYAEDRVNLRGNIETVFNFKEQ